MVGWTPTLDICCNDGGDNRLCQHWIGKSQDLFTQDLCDSLVWCNPPFEESFVRPLLEKLIRTPNLRALVVLPEWSWKAPLPMLLGRFQHVHCWPQGAYLFTCPRANGRRSYAWPTRWPVHVWQLNTPSDL